MTKHNHIAHHPSGAAVGNLSSYIMGFILSILLTLIPYYMVVDHLIYNPVTLFGVVVLLGVIQLLVQLVFFLHLGTESKPRWNLMAFILTVVVVAILVVGAIWIMWNLQYNMMPH